jgi:hypothetical protein
MGNEHEIGELHLVVASGGIVVTMPGTDFLVVYTKSENTPWLMVTKLEDDRTASLKLAEFLAVPGSLPTTRRANSGGSFERSFILRLLLPQELPTEEETTDFSRFPASHGDRW